MPEFFKAVRSDLTSFYDGTTAWDIGKTVSIPPRARRKTLCRPGLLHASDEPAETLIGGSWPCRLLVVDGDPITGPERYKFGFHELVVVREVESHLALGPNGVQVARFIESCGSLAAEQARELAAAWNAARLAAWAAARDAAGDAARIAAWDAVRDAARGAARDAAWDAVRDAAWAAARDAAWALVVRDLIAPKHFETLVAPWVSVMGRTWEEDR